MVKSIRDAILNNLDILINYTDDEAFEELFNMLIENDVLTPFMIEKITAENSSEKKKKLFYEMISNRGPYNFNKLCDCMFKVGLGNMANRLTETRLLSEECSFSKVYPLSSETHGKERYIISSCQKGYVLVINNEFKYYPQEIRCGSEKDVAYLEKVWTELGYKVIIKENLLRDDFMSVIDDFIDLIKQKKLYSMFIFIMTHGFRHESYPREVLLKMSDGEIISSEWILRKFSTLEFEYIPKAIFIQTSRALKKDISHRFACWRYNNISDGKIFFLQKGNYSNLLVVFSTLPGFVSKRYPNEGAPFIQELCSLIELRASNNHLIEIIHEVDRNLRKKAIKNLEEDKKKLDFVQIIHYENWQFSYDLYL